MNVNVAKVTTDMNVIVVNLEGNLVRRHKWITKYWDAELWSL